jgi:hypothetical protein
MRVRILQALAVALVVAGVLRFFAPIYLLPYTDTWLEGVELPTFFETSTIILPDGGRLTATSPTQRLQRYSSGRAFSNRVVCRCQGSRWSLRYRAY